MRTVGLALLFGFAVLGEAFSDVYLRVQGHDGKGGATAESWDSYMTLGLIVALVGIVYDLVRSRKDS